MIDIKQAIKPIYEQWKQTKEEDWWEGLDFEGEPLDINIYFWGEEKFPQIDVYECRLIKGAKGGWETLTSEPLRISFNAEEFEQEITNE
tara:strand:- start:285 stop:551 length:267 start_codon:yes stop_codon:yes gene_type:complete